MPTFLPKNKRTLKEKIAFRGQGCDGLFQLFDAVREKVDPSKLPPEARRVFEFLDQETFESHHDEEIEYFPEMEKEFEARLVLHGEDIEGFSDLCLITATHRTWDSLDGDTKRLILFDRKMTEHPGKHVSTGNGKKART